MANKIKWYETIDLKSIVWFLVTFTVVVLIFSISYLMHENREIMLENLKGLTKGKLEVINEKKIINQTIQGEMIRTDSYELIYSFIVNEELYNGQELVFKKKYNAKSLTNLSEGDTISIKYNLSNPNINMVKLD